MTYDKRREALNRREDRTILALVDLPNGGTRRMLENDLRVINVERKELLAEELSEIRTVCEKTIREIKAELASRVEK